MKWGLLERLLVVLGSATLVVQGFAQPHGAAEKLWAVVGVVAYGGAFALVGRRWLLTKLHQRRHPELQPREPNYNRTPYV